MVDAWIETWLSAPRFDRYVRRAGGDEALALKLYEWNAVVSAAVLRDLGHFEVALRNAYHRAMTTHTRWGDQWVFHGHEVFPELLRKGRDVNEKSVALLQDAIRDLEERRTQRQRQGKNPGPVTPGQVVAELGFGFWFYFSRGTNEILWRIEGVHKEFAVERKVIHGKVEVLHALRNRVAHHEPVYDSRVWARQQVLFEVTDLIDPTITNFIGTYSMLKQLEAKAPIPGLLLR